MATEEYWVKMLNRLEDKLDENTEQTRNNAEQTALNTQSLIDHMQQTMLVRQELAVLRQDMHSRVPPLERHVAAWAGAGKAFATLGIVGGIAAAVAAVLRVL